MEAIHADLNERRKLFLSHIQEVTESEEWKNQIQNVSTTFQTRRQEFLVSLESQPNFLQSPFFLSLHSKLKKTYF